MRRTAERGSCQGRRWTSLKRRADFLRIAASGLRKVTPAFIVQAAAATSPDAGQRIGFTVSRKVGNAVARNRAKRRLRALADQVLSDVPSETLQAATFEYVLVGRGDALTRDFAVMAADLRQAIERLATAKPTPYKPRERRPA